MSKVTHDFSIEDPGRLLSIPNSDGDASNGPHNPAYQRVLLGEPISRHWRGTVGTFIAKYSGYDVTNGKAWHLSEWPSGYSMWGKPRDGAPDKARSDYYLYGFKRRFCSPREFALHALWLFRNKVDGACRCTLCTGRNQGEINQVDLGEGRSNKRPAAPPQPADELSPNPPRIRRRITLFRQSNQDQILDTSPRQCVSRERDSDLRSGRRYRVGELVWVRIPPLKPRNNKEEEVIDFWPAIIKEQRLKVIVDRSVPGLGLPYQVVHIHQYVVVSLGVLQEFTADEESIIPFQAFKLRTHLEQMILSHQPSFPVSSSCKELQRFSPFPTPAFSQPPPHTSGDSSLSTQQPHNEDSSATKRTFENALAPLALALRTAKCISTYWGLSDEWKAQVKDDHETRWQGLFYGPERVWMDDLVRVNYHRSDLSGPGWEGKIAGPSPGAEGRGILLRARGIEMAESASGTRILLCGPLYELAPELWPGTPETDQHLIDARPSPSKSLSSPAISFLQDYPMPTPPKGFRFRLITPPNSDVCLPIQFIAGRFYPWDLIENLPKSGSSTQDKLQSYGGNVDSEGDQEILRFLSLTSLVPECTPIQCKKWKSSREDMLKGADQKARSALYARWSNSAGTSQNSGDIVIID